MEMRRKQKRRRIDTEFSVDSFSRNPNRVVFRGNRSGSARLTDIALVDDPLPRREAEGFQVGFAGGVLVRRAERAVEVPDRFSAERVARIVAELAQPDAQAAFIAAWSAVARRMWRKGRIS